VEWRSEFRVKVFHESQQCSELVLIPISFFGRLIAAQPVSLPSRAVVNGSVRPYEPYMSRSKPAVTEPNRAAATRYDTISSEFHRGKSGYSHFCREISDFHDCPRFRHMGFSLGLNLRACSVLRLQYLQNHNSVYHVQLITLSMN
jgi:hypothetical protein